MKKALSLILALALCLSLCACGESNNIETTDSTQPTTNSEVVLKLNEPVTVGNFEITITDVKTVESFVVYSELGSRKFGMEGSDSYQVVVLYTLKNIGKEEISALENSMSVEYSDGYTFDAHLYYHNNFNPDIFSVGGTQEGYVKLPALSGEVYFLEAIRVPVEAINNTDEPLKVRLNGKKFGVEEINLVYYIRSANEN